MTYYFDLDGVLANFHKEPFNYKNAISREWIANLDPFMHNIKIARELIANGTEVYICTKAASDNARLGKIDWLAKYIPEIDAEHFICVVGSGNKANYIKTENGTLIDDDIKNCRQWAKAGFTYIHLETKGMKIVLE
jgi:5'(3')-deoxyribonucleotidase